MTEYVRAETLDDTEDTEEPPVAQGTDAEVQDIIGRLTYADGTYWYEVTWKGYDFEDTTWHKISDLQSCKKHVAAYDVWLLARGEDQLEEVYGQRPIPNGTFMAHPVLDNQPQFSMAATEIPVQKFVRSQKGIDAVNLEVTAMTTKSFGGMCPRLIGMTEEERKEFSDPKSVAFKTMLKLRLTCCEKRATP